MACSDIECKICGVSFRIARIRRPDEPYYAAWDCCETSPGEERRQENFVRPYRDGLSDDKQAMNLDSDGCQKRRRRFVAPDLDTDDEDDDFVDEGESDQEPLEYISDDDTSEVRVTAFDDENSDEETDADEIWNAARLYLSDEPEEADPTEGRRFADPHNEQCKGRLRNDSESRVDHGRYCHAYIFEHLAGSDCHVQCGYSGSRISAEEMRGCTTSQCLVRKSSDWTPETDEMDCELNSDYFFSGVSVYMPQRNYGCPRYIPQRHGLDAEVYVDTTFWTDEIEAQVPFHPTCFEIFSRASRQTAGHIDLNGFMGWRYLESDYQMDDSFPWHPAVRRGRAQEWKHERDSEWLVANPVFVPGLISMLSTAGQTPIADLRQQSSKDPFAKLPCELADAILSLLDGADVASLRLASCARYLPISDWSVRIENDMPWLWELWDNVAPSLWATVSWAEVDAAIKARDKAYKDYEYYACLYPTRIKEEMPEIWEAWAENNQWLWVKPSSDWRSFLKPKTAAEQFKPFSKMGTNWTQIYYDVAKRGDELKGLQNRRRIWIDVQEILQRISKYREQGAIA